MASRESAVTAATETGSEYALEHFRTVFDVETKSSKTDLVTNIDRSTQRRIVEMIREQFPDDIIAGEENDQRATVPDSGYAWIIDPIDGTQNYVHGLSEWVTSVALISDGTPVRTVNVAPAIDDVYVATRSEATRNGRSISVSERTDPETFLVASTLRLSANDSRSISRFMFEIADRFGELRRTGSAQLTLSLVANGAFDAAVGLDPEPNAWDTVAGAHHVRQAGGTVTDLYGAEWTAGSPGVVASNGHAHDEVLAAVQAVID